MRRLIFNSLLQRAMAAVFVLSLFLVISCGEDEQAGGTVTVQFPTNNSVTLGEDDDATTVNLTLSSAAKKDGTITISASSNAEGALTFDAEISVTKGNTVAILHLEPTDNDDIDGNKEITLTLSDVTSGFEIGELDTYTVNLVDDEGPTTASFVTSSGSVSEGSTTGIEIEIDLTPDATANGSVKISIDPTDAAITTDPAAADGVVTVSVPTGSSSVKFKVTPVNNEDDDDDTEITFTLTEGVDGVQIGTADEYTLTITDDDDIVPTAIADVRAMYTSSDVSITTDTYIQGVVTSVSGSTANVHQNGMYIQDESGAIYIYFAVAHEKARGAEVMINLNGSTLTSYNGLLEISGTAVANIIDIGTGTLPEAKLITVAELAAGTYESQLVTLQTVSFPDADGIITMSGSKTLSDGTNTSVVYTRSSASFYNQIVPLGSGTVTGIVSDFNGIQLLPQVFSEDIFASNPVGSITLSGTSLEFGSVANGEVSTSQSYTVTGTGLTNSINVTATNGFEVSSDNVTFSASVTLAVAGGTVYVRFAPSSGVNQTVESSITHKSQGAATVTLNVTGTETGNEGSGTLLYSTGFESSESFTASTTYNNTTENVQGPSGQQWGFVYGTPSTTSPIVGSQSGQLRWYTAAASTFGYAVTKFSTANLTSVVFTAASTGALDVKVEYSYNGTDWSGSQVFDLGDTSAEFQYNLPALTGAVYLKFTLTLGSTTPTSTSRVYLDEVKFYGE